jgi:hypothetical protein
VIRITKGVTVFPENRPLILRLPGRPPSESVTCVFRTWGGVFGGGTSAPSVPIYASAAYGCALAHSPQTTREVRATFYSRLSQYGPHAAPCTFCREGPCPNGPGGGPPALHARFPSVPTAGGGDLTGDLSMPHSGVRSRGGLDL